MLDITSAGHQPMVDQSTGNVITYNGEIYNFRELKADLEKHGHTFRSSCDTEVVLALFAEHGISFVERLRGIFAIVIWESDKKRLWLVRDHLGVKPLYYYRGPEGLSFASECRGLHVLLPDKRWGLSREGLSSFMMWGSVSEPFTLWDEIKMLPSGTYACFDGMEWHEERYWDPWNPQPTEVSEDEALRETRRLLEESAQSQTVSDVPLGVFLSGGIDSSVLLALVSGQSNDLQSLTVAFPEFGYDESPYARLIAEMYGVRHRVVTYLKEQISEQILAAIDCQDQPSIDGINVWIVSRAARQSGMTVALCGHGGDELFFGYRGFRQVQKLRSPVARVLGPIVSALPVLRQDKRERLRAITRASSDTEAFPWIRAFWGASELQAQGFLPRLFSNGSSGDRSIENQLSQFEIDFYLKNTLLRDADVMSMSHGLEIRVPFLDHRLVEYVLSLPAALKWGDGRTPKYLLIKAVNGLLPDNVVYRRKSGFSFPFDRWFRGPMRPVAESALGRLDECRLFGENFLAAQWKRFLRGRLHYSRILQFFVLERHLRKHWDGESVVPRNHILTFE